MEFKVLPLYCGTCVIYGKRIHFLILTWTLEDESHMTTNSPNSLPHFSRFWSNGQPQGAVGVNCVFAVNAPGLEGQWFLSNCGSLAYSLCQFQRTFDCDGEITSSFVTDTNIVLELCIWYGSTKLWMYNLHECYSIRWRNVSLSILILTFDLVVFLILDPCLEQPCDSTGDDDITCSSPGFGIAQCSCNTGFELQTPLGPCVGKFAVV